MGPIYTLRDIESILCIVSLQTYHWIIEEVRLYGTVKSNVLMSNVIDIIHEGLKRL